MLPEAVVYCDGSSSPKNKTGGWAAVVMLPTLFVELVGHAEETTNNRMELMAAIQGLKELKDPHRVYLVSDSAYLLNSMKNKWYDRWFADDLFFDNAFAKQMGRYPRPNLDLWKILASLAEFHEIVPVKVVGHAGDHFNELTDKLAGEARRTKVSYRRELPEGYIEEEEVFRNMVKAGTGVLVLQEKSNGD